MTAAHPTEVDMGAGADNSGYITFEDPLGQYMEVTSMDSVVFGGVRYKQQTSTTEDNKTTVTFTEPTELAQPNTGEKLGGIIGKVSLAIKNIKTLITLIGNTDIKSIGDGTVTGAISDVNGKLESKIYSIPIKAKESKTITVELYACAMLLVAGATMYYFCNGYLISINVSDSVTMGLSSDYRSITVSNTTEVSNYFLSIVAFSDISYTIS